MDTFGGPPTEGEGVFLAVFICVVIFGLGCVTGIIVCHYLLN